MFMLMVMFTGAFSLVISFPLRLKLLLDLEHLDLLPVLDALSLLHDIFLHVLHVCGIDLHIWRIFVNDLSLHMPIHSACDLHDDFLAA